MNVEVWHFTRKDVVLRVLTCGVITHKIVLQDELIHPARRINSSY